MNYRIQEKSNSDLSGIRVTEYINGNVSVSGSGSYADPWQFSDIISLHVNTTNKLRGRVSSVDCSNNSMKKETITLTFTDGGNTEVYLCPENGYKVYTNSCSGYMTKDTGNRYVINGVKKDNLICNVAFTYITNKVNLLCSGCSVNPAPSTLYASTSTHDLWFTEKNGTSTPISKINTVPQKTGYTFKGFYKNSNQIIDVSGNMLEGATAYISGTTDLNAKFEVNTYTFTLNAPNATSNNHTTAGYVVYDEDIPNVIVPQRIYTVNYDANGGSVNRSSDTVTYTFDGYFYNGIKYIDSNGLSAHKWDIPSNVTLNGTWSNGNVTLAIPTRTGHVFKGWTVNSDGSGTVYNGQHEIFKFMSGSNTSVTLYAKWERCGNGTYLSGNSCVQCSAGYYSAAGSASCSSCPAGTYSAAGASSCTSCPAGSYCSGGTNKVACPAGTYSAAGASSCSTCIAGYRCPGGTNRIQCAAGTYAAAGASSCTSCSAGYYSAAGASSCSGCAAGKYSAAGASSCTSCTAGYRCPGSSNRIKCAAGTYAAAGSSSCTSCSAGYYSAAGAGSCSACPAGKYSGAGASSCTTCQAGYYCPGSSNRSTCTAGTYSAAGASSCTLCPAGQYSSAGASGCTSCAAGTYSTGGASSCTACPSGTTSAAGASSCYTIYEDKWVAGASGITEFNKNGGSGWSSVQTRLHWQEYYNAYTNQSYLYFSDFQAKSTAGAGVVYAGGGSGQTRGIFVLDSAGNKELIQKMSYHAGDTAFNFLNSRKNTWFSQNSGSTVPPWESKVYNHNSDGTLTLTLRVDLMMLPISSSFSAQWNNVDKTITLTDLR